MKYLTSSEYYERVHGSWIGRVVGDFVGAPLELRTIKTITRRYGEIDYYPQEINLNAVNDDEMYEIIALLALEKYGLDLKSKDIALEWVSLLKYDKAVFTAEKVALNNIKSGILPPKSGTYNNPYFDFIGAQMRADIWGQIAPGCPEIVKYYCELDGSISHSGIGIEGEVFVALLISNAFFEKDIRTTIEQALRFLPNENESLYTRTVKKAIEMYELYPNDFRKAREILIYEHWSKIKKDFINLEPASNTERATVLKGYESKIHVLPNIGIIILSLLYGDHDKEDSFGRSICIAGMMGYDADCNCGLVPYLGLDWVQRKSQ
ncbi:MAG: ADP-ribosylglycohydrolase family protein [Candidatus Lokiarchaeota archaeon]|nr:ADP-ribosylglycohydrolase family protein [Candidatus Lokiarchaeota archaeon]